jgi:hypothetical protein
MGYVKMGLGLYLAGGRSDLREHVRKPCRPHTTSSRKPSTARGLVQLRREPRLPRAYRIAEGAVQSINQDSSSTWVASETGNRATVRVMPFARNDIITVLAGAKSRVSEKQLDNRSGLALVPG